MRRSCSGPRRCLISQLCPLTWKQDSDSPRSVSLEVQNLFNKYYCTSLYEQFASPGTNSGAPGLPQTLSLTLM